MNTYTIEAKKQGAWYAIDTGTASDLYNLMCNYYPDFYWPYEEGAFIDAVQSYDPMGLRINFLA